MALGLGDTIADLRISELPELKGVDVQANDDIAVADYSSSETRRLKVKELIQNGVQLIDDGSIPGAKLVTDSVTALQISPNAITASELANNSVDTDAILDSAVTNDKVAAATLTGNRLADNTITATQIAADAITDSELADNAVDTAAIQNDAVVNAKVKPYTLTGDRLVAGTLTAREIADNAITASELADNAVDTAAIQDSAVINAKVAAATLTGDRLVADTLTSREIARGAITVSEMAGDSVDTAAIINSAVTDAKIANGIDGAKLTDGTVTDGKLASGIDGAKIKPDTLTSREIARGAITISEMSSDSVDTAAIINSAVTNAKIAAGIDGAKLTDGTVVDAKIVGLNGSKLLADSVTAAKIDAAEFDRGIDKLSGKIGITKGVAAGLHSGIQYDAQGLIISTSPIQPAELPIATAATVGASSYPTGSGLLVSGVGGVTHEDSVTAGTTSGITYNASGHITNAVALQGSDLPLATSLSVGVVSVSGPVLSVDTAGKITHRNTLVTPGVYPKVSVDAQGHVTAGSPLGPADIPSGLDAAKLTTGILDPARFDDLSIPREKLADYAISYIQEATPDVVAIHHAGCLWYQESTAQLRMWNKNSWMPVGFGRLAQENLRFCGTFDATAGKVLDLTAYGTTAGLISNSAIPAADDSLTGVYLVCKTPGTHGGDAYDAGDWILCLGLSGGWVRVDTLSGAGGSASIKLEDLLDVNITTPVAGDTLIIDAVTNKWVNRLPFTLQPGTTVEEYLQWNHVSAKWEPSATLNGGNY